MERTGRVLKSIYRKIAKYETLVCLCAIPALSLRRLPCEMDGDVRETSWSGLKFFPAARSCVEN
jgi:hypothetical protein